MRRIILALAFAGILSVPAKADETLKFRVVQYAASVQVQPIGDVKRAYTGVRSLSGARQFS